MKYILLILTIISGLSAFNYHGCALAPDNLHGWVVCLDTVLILHTSDGGSTWQPQTAPGNARKFFDVTAYSILYIDIRFFQNAITVFCIQTESFDL